MVIVCPFSIHFVFPKQSRMSLGSVTDLVSFGILLPIRSTLYFFFNDLFLQSSQTNLTPKLFVSICYLTADSLQKILAFLIAILSQVLFT